MFKDPKAAVHPDVDSVLLSPKEIQDRIKELAAQISRDYAGKEPILIGVLKGSILFLSDLMRELTIPCSLDFISLSSYEGDSSTGEVRLLLDLRQNPHGKHLLIIEDIVDTGLSLSYLVENLRMRHPASLEICVLLDKKESRKIFVDTRYVGFSIPNRFVVGYGLDYNEHYRNLSYVGIMKKSAVDERAAAKAAAIEAQLARSGHRAPKDKEKK